MRKGFILLLLIIILISYLVYSIKNEEDMIEKLVLEYPEEADEHIYQAMETLDNMFNEHNIRYIVDYGTLLGTHREGQRIRYDSDIDLSIDKRDWKKFIHMTKNHNYPGVTFHKHFPMIDTDFYRYMRLKRGSKFDNIGIDIEKSDAEFSNLTQNLYKLFRISMPVYLNSDHIFNKPLERAKFGPIMVSVPNEEDTVNRLTKLYGDWKTPRRSNKHVHLYHN